MGNHKTKPVLPISANQAALIVGIAFVTSVIIVTLVDDFLLANFVVPGDTEKLAHDIESSPRQFGFAVFGYMLVLLLDTIIGLALFVVLKPSNKNLALLTSALRLLYAFILMIGVLALALQISDVHGYAYTKLIGYLFFAVHILMLGYTVYKSGYLPNSLGVLLMLASFTYLIFFVDFNLPKSLNVVFMLIMAIAELSLSIWLILNRNRLPEY